MEHLFNKAHHLSLSGLGDIIKRTLKTQMPNDYWVVAEIASIKEHASGHYYITLVEKKDGKIAASMGARIWAFNSGIVKSFNAATGQNLKDGMKVLSLVTVVFHELYGLQLYIKSIDPSYTLGEMALVKKQIIERLTKEGIIDNNKKLPLPMVIQNIAIISSITAAGLGDFRSIIKNKNINGYNFNIFFIEALMQGEKVEDSLLSALTACKNIHQKLDAIVIIRGGGSTVDLHCFDNCDIAREIALLPVPVFSGIGHDKDETVVDVVAHMKFPTPTAVAEFILDRARQFELKLDNLRDVIVKTIKLRIAHERGDIDHHSTLFFSSVNSFLALKHKEILSVDSDLPRTVDDLLRRATNRLRDRLHTLSASANRLLKSPAAELHKIETLVNTAPYSIFKNGNNHITQSVSILNVFTKQLVKNNLMRIDRLSDIVSHLDPANVLKRGYSITLLNGKAIKNTTPIKHGDIVDTILSNGAFKSEVITITNMEAK